MAGKSWKASARRQLIGDLVPLKSTGGELSIAPKKLSIDALDQIRELQHENLPPADIRRKAMEIKKRHPELTDETKDEDLDDELKLELTEIWAGTPVVRRKAMYAIAFRGGIGRHDWNDDNGELINGGQSLDEETIKSVLEIPDVAEEMYGIIMGFARPLAQRNGGISATSSTASSTESSTTKPEPTSPTTPES